MFRGLCSQRNKYISSSSCCTESQAEDCSEMRFGLIFGLCCVIKVIRVFLTLCANQCTLCLFALNFPSGEHSGLGDLGLELGL